MSNTSTDKGVEGRCPFSRHSSLKVSEKVYSMQSQGMSEEYFSFEAGVFYTVVGKLSRCLIKYLSESYPTFASSFFAWSAVATASMISSRSPSSTDSRL